MPTTAADGAPLLHTVEGAAARLSLGRTHTYALVASGAIRSVKVGRSRRIPEAALREFVAALEGGDAQVTTGAR